MNQMEKRTKETQTIFRIFRRIAKRFKYNPDHKIYSYRDKHRHAIKTYDTQRDCAKARHVWERVLIIMKAEGITGYELLDNGHRGWLMNLSLRFTYVSGIKKYYRR